MCGRLEVRSSTLLADFLLTHRDLVVREARRSGRGQYSYVDRRANPLH